MVVVDRFTKYSHSIPSKHPFTTHTVARAFLNNIVKLHGISLTIVSDRDKIFNSAFWKELFRCWGTQLQMSTAYHPQTDGQKERVNQCLKMYLRCPVHESLKQWFSWFPLAEFWYNAATIHRWIVLLTKPCMGMIHIMVSFLLPNLHYVLMLISGFRVRNTTLTN